MTGALSMPDVIETTAYGMPAWQQESFGSANATPGGGQDPMEQFGNTPFPNSSYGIPSSFSPVTSDYTQNALTPPQQTSATPNWQNPPQQPSPWGNTAGTRNTWGGRNSQGWGQSWGR
jgi:hypothetical protein